MLVVVVILSSSGRLGVSVGYVECAPGGPRHPGPTTVCPKHNHFGIQAIHLGEGGGLTFRGLGMLSP